MGRMLLLACSVLWSHVARASDLNFNSRSSLEAGEAPFLEVTPNKPVKELILIVRSDNGEWNFAAEGLIADAPVRFDWTRDTRKTAYTVEVRAEYTDGFTEMFEIPLTFSYGTQLRVDLDGAHVDVGERLLTVPVNQRVDSAELVSYGARRSVLDRKTVIVDDGPGDIVLPWVGDPSDVVELSVTLRSGNTWSSFTYSPWFLDIPHEDVGFETNQAEIPESEAWKLEATLVELREAIELYGEVVPVKLFLAGCTDTVGNQSHNQELSTRRARAIASWFRAHGFNEPIYFYGFGESLPAINTGDGVDEPANRRVVYLVAANPPPAGSGIPQVRWNAL
ncbi:MAG: OmpA family protein [Myxococcota bacterium]|nr:OmpA family protein [Myxococcota bacterium]